MIKKLKNSFLIFIMTILIGCSNLKFEKSSDVVFNGRNLKIGDILIKRKGVDILSWFGHSGIIVSENMVGDIPKLGEKYYETNIEEWTKDNRDVIILRYKNIDEKFQKELLKDLNNYKNKYYKLNFNKNNTKGFYCSQIIWYLYKDVSIKNNNEIDLDSDRGIIVFPYDFIGSHQLKKVKIHRIKKGRNDEKKF